MSSLSSPASLPSQKPWSPSSSSSSRRFPLIRRLATKVKSLRRIFSTVKVEPDPVSLHPSVSDSPHSQSFSSCIRSLSSLRRSASRPSSPLPRSRYRAPIYPSAHSDRCSNKKWKEGKEENLGMDRLLWRGGKSNGWRGGVRGVSRNYRE